MSFLVEKKKDKNESTHRTLYSKITETFMSTDQNLTTYLIFHALFDGGVFEISYKGLHDLHGLYFPTNIFSIFLQFLLFFFLFFKKNFQFVGRKIYDVTKRERQTERQT